MRQMLDKKQVLTAVRFGSTKLWAEIGAGTFPPPVKIGRMCAWPDDEVAAINDARIARCSDTQIQRLVSALVRRRESAAKKHFEEAGIAA